MTIRYSITKGDLVAFRIRLVLRSRFLLVLWTIVLSFVFYTSFSATKSLDATFGFKVIYALVVTSLYAAFLIGSSLLIVVVRVVLGKNTGVVGEHRLTITDEGLMESTVHNDSMNRWSSYHRTVSTKNFLILFVTDTLGHFISKKRPLLEGDLVAFESALREKTGKL